MNPLTHRPSAEPKETHLAENVYRVVCALRADPRFAEEALPPEAYLAALDNLTVADATRPATPEERKS